MKPNDPLACGHPASLLVRSAESDYCFCELCEARSERNDALKMEEHLGARVRLLTAALRGLLDAGVLNPTGSERVAAAIQDARNALFAKPVEHVLAKVQSNG